MDISKLEIDLAIERGVQTKVRDGVKKLSIRGDYDGEYRVEFWDKNGTANGIEVSWSGHIHRDDMNKKEGTYWVWDYCTLRKKDVRQLIKWLIRMEKRLI